MLAIRVGKSVFFYFNPNLSRTFLQIGISACLFIGPALYFYLKSVVKTGNNSIKHWKYHFALLFLGISIIGILCPWSEYPEFWFTKGVYIVYWIWFVYILASGYTLRNTLKKLFIKSEKVNGLDFWLLSIFIGNFLVWIAYKTVAYTSYIVGALSFTFIFYLLFLIIHFKRKQISIFSNTLKYSDKKIDTNEAKLLSKNLKQLMKTEVLYKDANLKLQDVAKKLHINPHLLSQLLNDNLDISFTNFINKYRINAAKQLILSDEKLTLEAIGYECGFNSKSTFYTAFKKQTRMTPSQFKTQ